jgi:glycosidase
MPDLNYQTPAVLQEMEKATLHWLTDMGADGFRFDAVPYLVEEGSQVAHTRGTHDALRAFGDAIRRASSSAFTIGEMSEESALILSTYYPDQLDAYFAFGVAAGTMETARTGVAAPFLNALRDAVSRLPAGRWSPFLTNHDHVRVMTVLAGDRARARIAASAMLMLPGLPFVYYGEEIGMSGAKPDEQIRTPMQWNSGPGAGFTTGTPWENPQSDWTVTNVQAQDGDAGSLLNHYRRLIHLRHEHSALSGGDIIVGSASDGAIAAFVRRSPTETVLVVINFGAAAITQASVTLAAGSGVISTSRFERIYEYPSAGCLPEPSPGANSSIALGPMAPYGFCVFRLSGS